MSEHVGKTECKSARERVCVNIATHTALVKGGEKKSVLVILVPEHLVNDARTQVSE